ncbi:MAG TPA: hypothetical protein VNE17_09385 [Nitrolancea sp.]|nr:hypothetical protein [Nitrolancea sp.]
MNTWRDEIENAISAFLSVAELAGDPISITDTRVEYLPAPHRQPVRLPPGMMAVYAFWGDDVWLKVGKVGPKSNARYTSQHYYSGSAMSTLAGSLSSDPHMLTIAGFDPLSAGEWIRKSTHRANILLPAQRRPELLSLLEAFLHLRLRPRYEG